MSTMTETTTSVALVTTAWLANSHDDSSTRHADVVNSFLLYHAHVGVAKIFVFFDGDRESQLHLSALHPDVQALHASGRIELRYRDDAHDMYADYTNWPRLREVAESDVAARQMLNAELAMQLCLEHNRTCVRPCHDSESALDGAAETSSSNTHTTDHKPHVTQVGELRWLLHLDIDELLYLETFATAAPTALAVALAAFTTHLETQQVEQLTIANYEAVPTTLLGGNYFSSATRFRRHSSRVPLTRNAQQRLAFWCERSRHGHFFLFYDNGKSIVRVREYVAPASVHHWHLVGADGTRHALAASASNFFDPRRNVAVLSDTHDSTRATILHYPVCGLEWLCDKYERLGHFPDVWGGRASTERPLAIAPCFHTDARDVVMRVAAANADAASDDAVELLYRSHVLFDLDDDDANKREWRDQVAAGVCEAIAFPSELLAILLLGAHHEPQLQSQTDSSERNSAPAAVVSAAPTSAVASSATSPTLPANAFTTEKAWMLAAISREYL